MSVMGSVCVFSEAALTRIDDLIFVCKLSKPAGHMKATNATIWTGVCACAVSNPAEYGGARNGAAAPRTSLLSNVVAGHKPGAKGKLRCSLYICAF